MRSLALGVLFFALPAYVLAEELPKAPAVAKAKKQKKAKKPAVPGKPAEPPAPVIPPPVLGILELSVRGRTPKGFVNKAVRVAFPKGWEGDIEDDGRSVRLLGPDGEGELLIAAVAHPSEIGDFLGELRERHPGAVPSPPQFVEVPGIDPLKGERATRFEVTGRELGELVTIERGDVIVLFATLVSPNAWPLLLPVLARCYPAVQVSENRPS
ncbi:MAG: hypothetical protein HYV07_27920 [Deltaproteobacteria bacterium]|nr:hypothetical protein [Deltaproteobacteria bacterium]